MHKSWTGREKIGRSSTYPVCQVGRVESCTIKMAGNLLCERRYLISPSNQGQELEILVLPDDKEGVLFCKFRLVLAKMAVPATLDQRWWRER